MYCENCQFEIEEHDETQCPLCGGPLVASSQAPGGSAGRISLDLNDDSQGAFVLEDDDEEALQPQSPLAQEPISYASQEEDYAAPVRQGQAAPAYADSTTEMLDQALEEFDPMVDEHFKKKKKSSSSTTLLLLLLLICAAGGAGYYFFMMQEPQAPAPVAPTRVVQPKKQKAPAEKPAVPTAAPEQTAPAGTAAVPKEPEPAKPAQEAKKPDAAAVAPVIPKQEKPQEVLPPAKEPDKAAAVAKKTPAPAEEKALPRAAEETAAIKEPPRPAQEPVTPLAAEAPAVKTGKPVFSVMTDSCRNKANADAEMARLRKLGYDARIMPIDLGRKGVFYRVLIGAWANRAEARHMIDEVRAKLGKRDASIIPVMQ